MQFDPGDPREYDPAVLAERIRDLEQALQVGGVAIGMTMPVLVALFNGRRPTPREMHGALRQQAIAHYLIASRLGWAGVAAGVLSFLADLEPTRDADAWRETLEQTFSRP